MKNLIRLLFGIPVILSVPVAEPPHEVAVDILLEGLANRHSVIEDYHGCLIGAGYSYCPSLDECVRPWESYCKEFDFPYNLLYKGSGIIIPDHEEEVKNITNIKI